MDHFIFPSQPGEIYALPGTLDVVRELRDEQGIADDTILVGYTAEAAEVADMIHLMAGDFDAVVPGWDAAKKAMAAALLDHLDQDVVFVCRERRSL